MPIDFTTVIGCDAKYIEQLKVAVPTWRRHRPEIWQQPMVVFFDRDQLCRADLAWLDHPNRRLIEWPIASDVVYQSQRERMLAGFVHLPGEFVETPYWLKIDCDTVALRGGQWIRHEWFGETPDAVGKPVFVASAWPYSKPADVMDRLDDWGDTVPELAKFPRLNLPRLPGEEVLKHKRMASWVSFYRTDWTAKVAAFCQPGRIPVPSQDSFHWYCAARTGVFWRSVRMKDFGWANSVRLTRVKELAAEAMTT